MQTATGEIDDWKALCLTNRDTSSRWLKDAVSCKQRHVKLKQIQVKPVVGGC